MYYVGIMYLIILVFFLSFVFWPINIILSLKNIFLYYIQRTYVVLYTAVKHSISIQQLKKKITNSVIVSLYIDSIMIILLPTHILYRQLCTQYHPCLQVAFGYIQLSHRGFFYFKSDNTLCWQYKTRSNYSFTYTSILFIHNNIIYKKYIVLHVTKIL